MEIITSVATKTQSLAQKPAPSSDNAVSTYTDSDAAVNQMQFAGPLSIDNTDNNKTTSLAFPQTPNTLTLLNYSISPIDQFEHFSRLEAVLTYSDRHGGWIGLKNFINLYFSTVFHSFFGEHIEMHLIHMETRKKFCAHFALREKRAYRVIIMLNYRLWDKILLSASSLPDMYFRLPERDYLEKAALLNIPPRSCYLGQTKQQYIAPLNKLTNDDAGSATSSIQNDIPTDGAPVSHRGAWYEVSLSALCLIHRLEMIMFNDLRYNHASHVVTLGKFFANNNDVKNPFVVGNLYD